jgi:hypothetical protein
MSEIKDLQEAYLKVYSEGVASKHPDIAGQTQFAKKADEILARRKKNRAQSEKNAKLDAIGRKLYNMNKIGEEFESPLEKVRFLMRERDHEYSMARSELDSAGKSIKSIQKKLKGEGNIEAWVQSKITKAADYLKSASDYMDSGEHDVDEEYVVEKEMTSSEKIKEKSLKSKYDDSGMKANMIKQYGKEKGEKVYFATIRKKAMNEDYYNFIADSLVENNYADDYESAEIMIEHFSDEFISYLAEEYIEEKARGTKPKKTVHAYDVDETLFSHGKKGKPNVQVHVKDASGKRVKSLSNQEFNTHKLEKGHSYDFGEFQSAKKFTQTAAPNKKVIKHLQRQQKRGHNIHLITARSKFDDTDTFHKHLKKHGIDVPKQNIHYTGGMKGGDVGDKKVTVANAVAKKHKTSSVHMYDDAAKVHKSFEKEKQQHPTTKKVKTHLIKPDKGGESKVRSYQATKEEMSAYDYWKQFI